MPLPFRASLRRVLLLASCLSLVCAGWQPVSLAAATPSGPAPRAPMLGTLTPGRALSPVAAAAVDRSSAAVSARRWPLPGRYPLAGLSATGWRSFADGSLAIRPHITMNSGPAARPAALAPVGSVSVTVLTEPAAKAAGASGPALQITRTDHRPGAAAVSVRVDTALLSGLFGADYAARVRWLQRPVSGGRSSTLPMRTAPGAQEITATASATPMLVMATSTPTAANGAGSFAATSLRPSASWDVSAQTGSFAWSYPMSGVPAAAGPAPSLALSYSSQSVDGETGSTNNQPSAVGDGWELAGTGFLERSYATCSDDGQAGSADLCWKNQNATLSFGGHSGRLVQIGTSKIWRLQDDDGSRIEQLSGAVNGLSGGEYWRLTTTDGTQYYFGVNHIPGWVTGNAATNSAWGVPVAGNATGEPCHNTTFASSFCLQGWRWNLDYVLDPNQNSEVLYYASETNQYRENNATTVSYTAGGNLTEIDYGTRAGSELTGAVPQRMLLDYASRCTGTCGATTQAQWPDTPLDQKCPGATGCSTNIAPSFFTTKMLSKVHAQLKSGTTFVDVDAWTLGHSFPDPGDTTSAALWLDSVQRTAGTGTGAITLPALSFTKTPLHNRVNTSDGLALTVKFRISVITTETGAQITIGYTAQQCDLTTVNTIKANPGANSYRCFPQWWTPQTTPPTAAFLDWFHSYDVTSVSSNPRTGGAKDLIDQMYYDYTGTPAWRWDDSPATPDAKRTWSVYAGYNTVRVSHGDTNSPNLRSSTDYLFFQGKDGDHGASGPVYVTGSDHVAVLDSRWLAGRVREQTDTVGVAGSTVDDTINTAWVSAPTATDGLYTARMVRDGDARTATALSAGGSRTTDVSTSYDPTTGLPITVDDQGDLATAADDRCTSTSYADNATAWLRDYPSEVKTVGKRCGAAVSLPADAIADLRTSYDGQAWGAAASKGNPTSIQQVASYNADQSANWQTVSTAGYDALGRQTTLTDPRTGTNRTTSTAYAPTGAGPVTKVVTTNPLGWTVTDSYEPGRHRLLTQVDQNGDTTEASYDSLGRTTGVWTPDHTRATYPSTPVTGYAYTVSATAASSVKTTQLTAGATQIVSYSLYDGLLRLRQTQTPAEGGGRDVSDTFYDAAGRIYDVNTDWYDTAVPAGTIFDATLTVPSETKTSYDGAGRTSTITLYGDGVQLWQTSYGYGGDHVDLTPPAGAAATTSYTDARGNTSRLLTYHGPQPTGSYDTTSYSYAPAGQLKAMTDTAGNQWSWTYDVLGRLTDNTDPDRGTAHNSYDPAGRLTSSTDARGTTLDYSYDTLDRRTDEYTDPASAATQLAHWSYDTAAITGAPAGTLAIGQPATAVRYLTGSGGPAFSTAVTSYDRAGRPTGTSTTIPTGYGPLTGSYPTTLAYAVTGQLTSRTDPPVGGLDQETLTLGYDSLGQPGGLDSDLASYLGSVGYDHFGRLVTLGQSWSAATLTHTYHWQDGSNRLLETLAQRTAASNAIIADRHYSYDNSGDITAINDATPATGTDAQCFSYDYQQQLTEAWTPASANCADPRSDTSLGGPAPYWQSYRSDATGNRLSVVRHATDSTHSDLTDTYSYPAAGSSQPHAVQAISHSDASPTTSYGYDPAGDTTSRPGQTLSYDPEGHLATVQVGGSSQSNVYDANGNLLLRTDPNGDVTLYLADTQAYLTAGATAASATRSYTAPSGAQIAERATTAGVTGSKLYFLDTDNNGTITATLDTANNPVRRHFDPFGNSRDPAAPAWIDPNSYLNKPANPTTGTVHLGARDYDPATGRFLTVDPILGTTDPLQNNGYSYAHNNPVTRSDPSGLRPVDETGPIIGSDLRSWQHTENLAQTVASDENAYANAQSGWAKYVAQENRHEQDYQAFILAAMAATVCGSAAAFARGGGCGSSTMTNTLDERLDRQSLRGQQGVDRYYDNFALRSTEYQEVTAAERALQQAQQALTEDAAALPDDVAKTFRGGRYTTAVLSQDTVFYRAGVAGRPLGQYFSTDRPVGVLQTRIDKALPEEWPDGTKAPLDTGYAVRIPKGTTVYSGDVANQGGLYMGGTGQVYIQTPWNIPGVEVVGSWPLG
ncbi:MAG: RHS repeat-associated core domain-containing protein [Jatrophihabitantaceae bacterium]